MPVILFKKNKNRNMLFLCQLLSGQRVGKPTVLPMVLLRKKALSNTLPAIWVLAPAYSQGPEEGSHGAIQAAEVLCTPPWLPGL